MLLSWQVSQPGNNRTTKCLACCHERWPGLSHIPIDLAIVICCASLHTQPRCAPCCCVHTVGVLLEGGQGCWGVQVPELDGVIPAACQEGVPPYHIPVYAVHLRGATQVLLIPFSVLDGNACNMLPIALSGMWSSSPVR